MPAIWFNNLKGSLAREAQASHTSLSVTWDDDSVPPDNDDVSTANYFWLTLNPDSSGSLPLEVVQCVAQSGVGSTRTLIVVRGRENTVSRGWSAGTEVVAAVTAGQLATIQAAAEAGGAAAVGMSLPAAPSSTADEREYVLRIHEDGSGRQPSWVDATVVVGPVVRDEVATAADGILLGLDVPDVPDAPDADDDYILRVSSGSAAWAEAADPPTNTLPDTPDSDGSYRLQVSKGSASWAEPPAPSGPQLVAGTASTEASPTAGTIRVRTDTSTTEVAYVDGTYSRITAGVSESDISDDAVTDSKIASAVYIAHRKVGATYEAQLSGSGAGHRGIYVGDTEPAGRGFQYGDLWAEVDQI